MKLSDYIRAMVMRDPPDYLPKASPSPIHIQQRSRAIVEINRIGNNLNQLAKIANATGEYAMEDKLRYTLEELLSAIRPISKGKW